MHKEWKNKTFEKPSYGLHGIRDGGERWHLKHVKEALSILVAL